MIAAVLPGFGRGTLGAIATGVLVAGLAAPAGTRAQGFALYISPPRVEIQVKAGESHREVLEFHHTGSAPGRFRVYTNDWFMKADDSVVFNDALAPDSCRPWVAIERRELTIAPNGRYRYRFEVSPPAGTPARECRFAIMVEGLDTTKVEQGGISFPVSGRIGVIVYARVGGAEPRLSLGKASVREFKGTRQPVIEVTNSGSATGRLEGFLSAKDGAGREIELSPDNAPILPGITRPVVLYPVAEEGKKAPAIQFPLVVKGTLEWGKNREPLDLRFEP